VEFHKMAMGVDKHFVFRLDFSAWYFYIFCKITFIFS
jgi:hypothetical protein